jgi:Chromate transport protein ChrA
MEKTSLLPDLVFTFMKIGLFTFGGGYAMISLIDSACVEKKKWLTHDELMNITVIAESTPGPIAINCATYVGYQQAGFPGALLSTIGIVLPSFFVIYLISLFFENILAITIVANAFNDLSPAPLGFSKGRPVFLRRRIRRNSLDPRHCPLKRLALRRNIHLFHRRQRVHSRPHHGQYGDLCRQRAGGILGRCAGHHRRRPALFRHYPRNRLPAGQLHQKQICSIRSKRHPPLLHRHRFRHGALYGCGQRTARSRCGALRLAEPADYLHPNWRSPLAIKKSSARISPSLRSSRSRLSWASLCMHSEPSAAKRNPPPCPPTGGRVHPSSTTHSYRYNPNTPSSGPRTPRSAN